MNIGKFREAFGPLEADGLRIALDELFSNLQDPLPRTWRQDLLDGFDETFELFAPWMLLPLAKVVRLRGIWRYALGGSPGLTPHAVVHGIARLHGELESLLEVLTRYELSNDMEDAEFAATVRGAAQFLLDRVDPEYDDRWWAEAEEALETYLQLYGLAKVPLHTIADTLFSSWIQPSADDLQQFHDELAAAAVRVKLQERYGD